MKTLSWLDEVFVEDEQTRDREPVQKHASHDQSTHGNWAKGYGNQDGTFTADGLDAWLVDQFPDARSIGTVGDTWVDVRQPPEDGPNVNGLGPEGPPEFKITATGMAQWTTPPRYEPITTVYRAMHPDEWDQARQRGFLQSDTRETISNEEGTNAGIDPRTAASYLPRNRSGGKGLIAAIEVRPEDGWFTIRADSYLRTRQPVPLDRIKHVTPVLSRDENEQLLVPIQKHADHDQIYIDAYPQDDWIKQERKDTRFDPFGFEKHKGPGNHPNGSPQSVHGGGGSGEAPPLSMSEARTRLQTLFPKARVYLDESIPFHPEIAGGLVHGFERMAAEFPGVAEDVVLIRSGPDYITAGLAEQVWTGVRGPDAEYRKGLGFLINADSMTEEMWERSIEAIEASPDVRINTGSVASLSLFAEGVIVHEFGHAVHSRGLKMMSGEDYFLPDGERNLKLWNEMTGVSTDDMHRFAEETFRSFYPNPVLKQVARLTDETRFEVKFMPEGMMYRLNPKLVDFSSYASYHRGETFAEAFAIRHGPEGTVGKMPEEMNMVLDLVEHYAK